VRRVASILAILGAAGALVVGGTGAGGEGETYEVRAIFDNGGFMVPAEEVRIAGARVGEVSEVDVTRVGEAAHEDGSPEPGKAVIVMRIDDPGFQDFREGASCLIRPQGLLGERFVECRITEPRAPGTEPPPSLTEIADGEPGEGQHLLPLERNGKAVDLDLINNIMEEPYPDRFRLILNDLGAGFAARGEDLEAVIERANPALQRTDEVLAILAKQNRQLAQLAKDSDTALGPVARDRDRVSGFINNANVAAEATAERRADLEASFQKLPGFLTELRVTMTKLDEFATSSTPVVSDLGDAAPSLTRMTEALGPFSRGGRVALTSLGDAAEEAGPSLRDADPVLIRIREVAEASGPLGKELSGLLGSLRRNDGYENLLGFFFNAAGATNSYDSFGRFARLLIPINTCVDYRPNPESSCESFFSSTSKQKAPSVEGDASPAAGGGGLRRPGSGGAATGGLDSLDELPEDPSTAPPATEPPASETSSGDPASLRDARVLLDYLIGSGGSSGDRKQGKARR
jgi:ABC-type transporter Mla subunit MlaD